MTAPTCGARTWATPTEHVTCDREPGHDKRHVGDRSDGRHAWSDPVCRLVIVTASPMEYAYALSTQATRDIVASLQRQIDALDPAAAIAEAERRMVEAQAHLDDLSRIDYTCVAAFPAIIAAKTTAITVRDARAREWAALVEARDAKGGGA